MSGIADLEAYFATPATFGAAPTLGSANPYDTAGGDYLLPTTSKTDSLPKVASPSPNPITGTLGKVFDTFLDAAAVAGANKLIGTSYPTGQQSPQAAAAQKQAANQQSANTVFNWKPLALIGGAALVGIIGLAVVFRRK